MRNPVSKSYKFGLTGLKVSQERHRDGPLRDLRRASGHLQVDQRHVEVGVARRRRQSQDRRRRKRRGQLAVVAAGFVNFYLVKN